jgi:hypothetical protein
MADPSITDWITATSTVIAVGAAVAAAIYTKRSASEAAKAAKAAADQVELQRPRPIVLAEFFYSFSPNRGNMARVNDRDFKLQNIGDSPAFDVELNPLEVPGTRLETDTLPYLLSGAPVPCIHRLDPPRGISGVMGRAALFVEDAKTFFDQQSKNQSSKEPEFRYKVEFTVSYRALDGREFKQSCVLVVDFPSLSAWIESVGSLLETGL